MSYMPANYEEWKYCITVKCKISLNLDYVRERIDSLLDEEDYHTQKFIEFWGTDRHAQTLTWFQKAADELTEK